MRFCNSVFTQKNSIKILILGLFLVFFDNSFSQLAFPGAEGFGRYTAGGRGGRIIRVTNINDSGPGSLRAALESNGARIVVFAISGTITLEKSITVNNPYITIAGQTAPGEGICVKGTIFFKTNDVIVRGLRIRPGDDPVGEKYDNRDCLGVGTGAHECTSMIFDHCSFSWSVDELISTWFEDVYDITFQWCIFSEALLNSHHKNGAHSRGFLVGDYTQAISIHHNLFAHNNRRNCEWKGSTLGEFINNVIYNWGAAATHFAAGDVEPLDANYVNIIKNYYKAGPSTRNTFGEIWFYKGNWAIDPDSRVYTNGNYSTVNGDQVSVLNDTGHQYVVTDEPVTELSGIVEESASSCYNSVLAQSGACVPVRDAVDMRIINDVKNGTGKIIDSPNEVGGYPSLASGTVPIDSDLDGIPDIWEQENMLNPNNSADAHQSTLSDKGYTNIEVYINSLFDKVSTNVEQKTESPILFSLEQNFPNPFNPSTTITYSIKNKGHVLLKVYDILGKEVATLVNTNKPTGTHYATFYGGDLPTGMYIYKLETIDFHDTKTMVLLK